MAEHDLSPEILARLNQYREQIDAIDQQLIALLKERIGIVAQVGEMKRGETGLQSFIRSRREAVMLKDMHREFAGSDFHPLAAASIWRQIIAASTYREQPLEGVVLHTSGDSKPDLYWLMREYFGIFTDIHVVEDIASILQKFSQKPALLAAFPYPADSTESWWLPLSHAGENRPRIFTCLPFASDDQPLGLVAARLTPEATGDDRTLLVMEGGASTDAAQWLKGQSIIATEIDQKNDAYLYELKGHFEDRSPQIEQMRLDFGGAIRHITVLGAYSPPLPIQT